MAGTFIPRIDELQEIVGNGNLTMRANVHQPYAAAEHNRYYYKHPRGGIPNFLGAPFEAEHSDQLQTIADSGIENLLAGAIDAVHRFEDWVQEYAPVEFEALRNSTNLYVEDRGAVVYEKQQTAPYESWKE